MVLAVENGLVEALVVLQERQVKVMQVVEVQQILMVMAVAVVELGLLAHKVIIQLIVQVVVLEVLVQLLQLLVHQLQELAAAVVALGVRMENILEAAVALVVVDKAGVIKQADIQLMLQVMV